MLLKEETSSQLLYLRSIHIFGRNSRKADTILANRDASQIHASIRWNGHLWELIDHSRNGTFINDIRLACNLSTVLEKGQKIRFAPSCSYCWVVESLSPPQPLLISTKNDGEVVVLERLNFFPNEREPQASIHCADQDSWIWQSGDDNLVLSDGDLLSLPPNSWCFFNAKKNDETLDVGPRQLSRLENVSFNFKVSLDEEHVNLIIKILGRYIDLGERTHHYSLLILARQRVKDAQEGLDSSAQGWLSIEQLSKMLGIEPSHLNMQLFRARGQIAKLIPDQHELYDVIERRRGEVRFADISVEIIRGAQLEAIYDPFLTPYKSRQEDCAV